MQHSNQRLSPERVKYYRQDNGWSQELLAKASGLSLRTIQRAEKDGNSANETQLALAAALNIPLKKLLFVSPKIETHWKWRNIMQNLFALLVIVGATTMLVVLAGNLTIFIDCASILFILLFMYSATALSFGSSGLIKSIKGLRYLFANDISPTPATEFLATILKNQIIYLYASAFIGILLGSISIHANVNETIVFHRTYAVNLIILLYAALIAETLLRPLTIKLTYIGLATKDGNR